MDDRWVGDQGTSDAFVHEVQEMFIVEFAHAVQTSVRFRQVFVEQL